MSIRRKCTLLSRSFAIPPLLTAGVAPANSSTHFYHVCHITFFFIHSLSRLERGPTKTTHANPTPSDTTRASTPTMLHRQMASHSPVKSPMRSPVRVRPAPAQEVGSPDSPGRFVSAREVKMRNLKVIRRGMCRTREASMRPLVMHLCIACIATHGHHTGSHCIATHDAASVVQHM